MDASTLWYGVPSNSSHKFYGDNNLMMYINTSNTAMNNPIIGNLSKNISGNSVLNGTLNINSNSLIFPDVLSIIKLNYGLGLVLVYKQAN